MIENQSNELTLIYHSSKPDDKKTRAYVESITSFAIKTLDIHRQSLTETQLAEIAVKMDGTIHDLIDPTYEDQAGSVEVGKMSDADILTMLRQQPILLHTPILIIGKAAFRYTSSYDMIRENGGKTPGVGNIPAANIEEKRTIL